MHNPHISPRRRQIMLLLSYAIMTMVVFVVSAICILLILGYRFDFANRSLEQGGLVQFRSVPTGATITVDERRLNFTTPGKQNILVGDHDVEFTLEGYLPWRKSISLGAGELRWLNYARMIPNDINLTNALELEGADDTLAAPDRQYIAIVENESLPIITMVDIRSEDEVIPTQIMIDPESIPASIDRLSLSSWSDNSRYLIVKVKSGDETNFLRIDRTQSDGNPTNISQLVQIDIDEIDFEQSSNNELLAVTGQNVRRINLSAETVSAPLVSNATSTHIAPEGDIAFVSTEDDQSVVSVYIDDEVAPARHYDDNPEVRAAIGTYYSEHYLAISNGRELEIIKSPETDEDSAGRSFAEVSFEFTPTELSFSPSGRFVLAEKDMTIGVYDLETDETFSFSQPGRAAESDDNYQWLDSYYLYSTRDEAVVIQEFDGANQHRIVNVTRGSSATLSRDGTFLYSFVEEDDQATMIRARLILD